MPPTTMPTMRSSTNNARCIKNPPIGVRLAAWRTRRPKDVSPLGCGGGAGASGVGTSSVQPSSPSSSLSPSFLVDTSWGPYPLMYSCQATPPGSWQTTLRPNLLLKRLGEGQNVRPLKNFFVRLHLAENTVGEAREESGPPQKPGVDRVST